VLADNKLAENAGWDKQILMLEVADLDTLGFDLSLIGFSDRELTSFAAAQHRGLTDPDDVPEPPVDPVSRIGDVWLLGPHRLLCGDCTDAAAVSAALAGIVPHLMVTDPPYGVNYDPAWRERSGLSDGSTLARGEVLNDNRADWREAWLLFPGDVAYVWHSALHASTVATSLEAAGFLIRSQIIWDKTRLVISRGDYHWRHEPAWYAVRKGKTGHWAGDRKQTTIWEIPHAKSETGHGTEKPVVCMQRPIENNSSTGQAIYDPFCGSGTTIIAAEITGRVCHGIELSPTYVDVAIKRWQAFTGQTATLEGSKENYAELAARRTGKPGIASALTPGAGG
jgi:DNA modification methylase